MTFGADREVRALPLGRIPTPSVASCFITQVAKGTGREGFEHAKFEPVGLTGGAGRWGAQAYV